MNGIVKLENAPELQGIEKSKAEQIRATFEPMVVMLQSFEEKFTEVVAEAEKQVTKDVTVKAKRLRIDIGNVRIATEKIRVAQKEEYLRAGKAIDGVSNILKWAVTDKENRLKEIETHFETQEKMRLEALQVARAEMLLPYLPDAYERKLSDMPDDVWDAYLSTKRREYEDRIAAEKQAELDRIAREKAEAEERERIKAENERLKAEAEAKEKAMAAERAKAEAERKAMEEKAAKERAEAERKLLAEREAARLEAEKAAAERARLEAEIRAKAEAEESAKREAEARSLAELSKGDADKVIDLISDLKAIKSKYSFKSAKNQKMYADVCGLIDKIVDHINK